MKSQVYSNTWNCIDMNNHQSLNPFAREFKIFKLRPRREFFFRRPLFRVYRLIVSMATRHACHVTHQSQNRSVWHIDRFYFVFPVLFKIFTNMLTILWNVWYSDSEYVQVNLFGSLNTFISTVLVNLYRVMGAAMLVRAESELWDLQHANSSFPPETH